MNEDIEFQGDILSSLLEIAMRDQNTCSTAIQQLQRVSHMVEVTTTGMPDKVASAVSQALDRKVAEAVRQVFAEFTNAKTEADQAAQTLSDAADKVAENLKTAAEDATQTVKQAAALARWKIWGVQGFGFAILVTVAGLYAWYELPSLAEIKARRDEMKQLSANIATMNATIEQLKAQGGDAILSTCGPHNRACVKTNEREQAYGSKEEGFNYRILYGH